MTEESIRELDEFPLVIQVEVRFRDIDGMGHVNNAVFATFFEIGRTVYFQRVMDSAEPADIDFILARQEIDFLRPIGLSDEVELGIGLAGLGRTSFRFEYLLMAAGEPAARGRSVQVFFDYDLAKKKPIPEEFRLSAEEFERTGGRKLGAA